MPSPNNKPHHRPNKKNVPGSIDGTILGVFSLLREAEGTNMIGVGVGFAVSRLDPKMRFLELEAPIYSENWTLRKSIGWYRCMRTVQ